MSESQFCERYDVNAKKMARKVMSIVIHDYQ